jgi:hypothetical protein
MLCTKPLIAAAAQVIGAHSCMYSNYRVVTAAVAAVVVAVSNMLHARCLKSNRTSKAVAFEQYIAQH